MSEPVISSVCNSSTSCQTLSSIDFDRYDQAMGRWQPASRERLQQAALELFSAKGFDETTVVEIALAAGLTERTFYRYFADKREVLFGVQAEFQQAFVDAINRAPADALPLDMVAS